MNRPILRGAVVIAGLLKIGTWRAPGSSRLVCIKRGLPTLRISVDKTRARGHFDEFLIGVTDAQAAANAIDARTSERRESESP